MENEMKITTNRLNYQLDLSHFASKYTVLRMRPEGDKRPVTAYEYIRALSPGLVQSFTVRTDKNGAEFETWYYLMTYPSDTDRVRCELQEYSDGKVSVSVAELKEDFRTEIMVLNLLLNSIKLESLCERSNTCESKLYILRNDNFGCKAAPGELIVLSAEITRQGCIHAHNLTFSPYQPNMDDKPEKKPLCYYYVDHLEMSLSRELPADWKEQYEEGTLHIYRKRNRFGNTRNVVNQYDMNQEREQCTKTDVLYRLLELMKKMHGDILPCLEFRELIPEQMLRDQYEKNAKQVYSVELKGCSYAIDDTVENELSAEIKELVGERIGNIADFSGKRKSKVVLMHKYDGVPADADCLLKIVAPKPENSNETDEYRLREYPELKGEGKCIQHIVVDKQFKNSKFLSPAIDRIMKELAVKRMISLRQLPDHEMLKTFTGWTFATARQIEKGRYIGMTMYVGEGGKLLFGRLDSPSDVPGFAGRQQSNMLSMVHEYQLTGHAIPPYYPSPEQYYIVTTKFNCYGIFTTDEQPLPEFEKLLKYQQVLSARKTYSAAELTDYLKSEGIMDLPYELEKHIYSKNVYTAEELGSLSRSIGKGKVDSSIAPRPDIKNILLGLVKEQPLLNQIKTRKNVDNFFGGLVDIHSWKDERNHLHYVSSESGLKINNVRLKKYAGLPHVRVVVPLRSSHPEYQNMDYQIILSGLQIGFGKTHHGSVLPFPFKILDEMCDLQCLKKFGFHWENMNKKNMEGFKDQELDRLDELFGG